MRIVRVVASLAVVLVFGGCLFRGDPSPVHFFRPESKLVDTTGGPSARGGPPPALPPGGVAGDAVQVRLRHVDAAAHLKERMVRRPGDVEVEFADGDRWAEPPAALVERAVGRALFEGGGIARSESSAAARLDVEVRAFEAVGRSPGDAVVAIWASLTDGREGTMLIERTYIARRPLADGGAAALARAIGPALDEAVGALSSEVAAAVRKVVRK